MLCIHGFPEVMYTCFYYFVIFTVIAADVFVNQIKHEILLTKFTIPALREKKLIERTHSAISLNKKKLE